MHAQQYAEKFEAPATAFISDTLYTNSPVPKSIAKPLQIYRTRGINPPGHIMVVLCVQTGCPPQGKQT